MFPNNVSSQWYATQERIKSNSPKLDSDGVPIFAKSFRPGWCRIGICKFLFFIGKQLVRLGKLFERFADRILEAPIPPSKRIPA